jgi:hypothetical protein
MVSQLGCEFRQGAEDPPFWQNDDQSEELSRCFGFEERSQVSSSTQPLEDPDPGLSVDPDIASTADPGVTDQETFSTPLQEA